MATLLQKVRIKAVPVLLIIALFALSALMRRELQGTKHDSKRCDVQTPHVISRCYKQKTHFISRNPM